MKRNKSKSIIRHTSPNNVESEKLNYLVSMEKVESKCVIIILNFDLVYHIQKKTCKNEQN